MITDRHRSRERGRRLVDTVTAAVSAGAPAVLLREKDLATADRRALALELVAVTASHGADLLVAGDAGLASAVGAAGVHLAADQLPPARRGLDRGSAPIPDLLVGRSCHDHAEVAAAVAASVDYVTLSPVATTASKPGYGPPLGPSGLAALTVKAGDVPLLALGGVDAHNAGRFRAAGAYGVAVMGAVMAARDPADVVTRLLRELPEEDPR